MNPIEHSYVIDLQTKYNRITQYEIKQFDTDSHKFKFTLLNNSVAYNLTGLTGKIYIKKPNADEVFSSLTIDNATGGKLSFLLTTQCLTVPGTVEAEITLYGTGGEVLTSITFTYIVKPVLRDDESIESTNEYTALTEALAEVQNIDNRFAEVNSLLEEIATREVYIKDFPRSTIETNDTRRFQEAIQQLKSSGGGSLYLDSEIYNLNSFDLEESVNIVGKASNPYLTNIGTVLNFIGTSGTFINTNAYYERKPALNLLIKNNGDKTTNTIGVKICTNLWGSSINIENCSINGFGKGIVSHMSYQMSLKDIVITKCGTALAMLGAVVGYSYSDPSSCFGNVNSIERVTFNLNDISLELESQRANKFTMCDFENCKISILLHKNSLSGSSPSSQNVFDRCWSENVEKYIICNSVINELFEPTEQYKEDLNSLIFKNFSTTTRVPLVEIPTFNTNYKTFTVNSSREHYRIPTDENMKEVYNKAEDKMLSYSAGALQTWRDIFAVSNKGIKANISFNLYEKTVNYTTTGTTTQTIPINTYGITQLDAQHNISSLLIMSVCVSHNDGGSSQANFILFDQMKYMPILCSKLGEYGEYLSGEKITVTNVAGQYPNNKTININVTANIIKTITVKVTYLPTGIII